MAAAAPRIWTIPILIGVVSSACLIVALVDDGVWDLLASLGLAAVLGYASYKGFTMKG